MSDEITTKQQDYTIKTDNSIDEPKVCITLEDFNAGNGYIKMNLNYMTYEQVTHIENLVSSWHKQESSTLYNKKYNVGDWIIKTENNLYHNLCQIRDVSQNGYIVTTQDKNITYISAYDAHLNYRKWNYLDMVPGNVYVSYGDIFMFCSMDSYKIHYKYLFDGKNVITDDSLSSLRFVTPAFDDQVELYWQKVSEYVNTEQEHKHSDEKTAEDSNTPEAEHQSVFCYGSDNGDAVIKALENAGGKNIHNYNGNKCQEYDTIYYINSDNEIVRVVYNSDQIEWWNVIVEKYYEIKQLKPEGSRCAIGESYYYIDSNNRQFVIKKAVEGGYKRDRKRYNFRNYFMSLSKAEEILSGLEKLNF